MSHACFTGKALVAASALWLLASVALARGEAAAVEPFPAAVIAPALGAAPPVIERTLAAALQDMALTCLAEGFTEQSLTDFASAATEDPNAIALIEKQTRVCRNRGLIRNALTQAKKTQDASQGAAVPSAVKPMASAAPR